MPEQTPNNRPASRATNSAARLRLPIGVITAFGYIVALLLFLVYADDIYSAEHRVLAWMIFVAGTLPIIRFLLTPKSVPLLEFVSIQVVILFSLPVFFETRLGTLRGYRVPEEGAITLTLACTLLAVIAIGLGYRFAARTIRLRLPLLSFPTSNLRLFVFAAVSVLGSLLLFSGAFELSPGLMQPLVVMVSQDLGITILALLFYRGRLRTWQKNAARILFLLTLVVGLVGGSTQGLLQPVLILMTCKWVVTRKGPTRLALAMGAVFFLLQPVKSAYRAEIWYGRDTYTLLSKMSLYGSLVSTHWGTMFTDAGAVTEQVRSSASQRLSLLLSTAHYIELTPSQVDFKNGATLAYMAYGWVPRFLWPEKPIAQIANKLLPVEYGLQSDIGARTTMFGVGSVAEVYTNFGVFGILPVFFILGLLYQLPVLLLGAAKSSAEYAIVIAATVNVMWIGSTISHAFGGILQQMIVQAILLRAFTMVRRRSAVVSPGPDTRQQGIASGAWSARQA